MIMIVYKINRFITRYKNTFLATTPQYLRYHCIPQGVFLVCLTLDSVLFVSLSLRMVDILYLDRSSRRAILLKYLFFFSRSDFLKRFLEHIKFYRRTKNITRTNINFPAEAKGTRTHQNFQESFPSFRKNIYDFPGGKIKFSRRAFSEFCKNRYDFAGDYTFKNRYFVKLPGRILSSQILGV